MAILLIFSTACTETHAFILDHFPESYNIKVDAFFSPTYKNTVNVLWLIKMIFESLHIIAIFLILMQLATSMRMFLIFTVYFLYNVLDFFLFMWNFKETTEIYYGLVICSSIAVLFLIFSNKYKYKMHSV